MLTITNDNGNANKNHNEFSPHTFIIVIIKKNKREKSIGEFVKKLELLYTVDMGT